MYEKNYPSYKVKLLAFIQGIKKWKHMLSYHSFEVHTDGFTLKYLTTMNNQYGTNMVSGVGRLQLYPRTEEGEGELQCRCT